MKRIYNFLLLTMAALFIFGSANLNGQTEVWSQAHPTWNKTVDLNYNFRGMAVNADLNHLYVAGNTGGAAVASDNKIQVLDASTGDLVKTLTLEPLSLVEMGYGLRDVEVDDAGGIYAIISTQNRFNPLKLFYWANEDASPVQLFTDFPARYSHSLDFAAGFSVKGDFNSEALIMIPFHNEDSIYYFEATNGSLGDLKIMGLDVLGTGGTYAQVTALGSKLSDGFWYNNSKLQAPTKFDGSGNIVGTINPAIFTDATGGIQQFTVGANTYLSISNAGNVVILDITGAAADFSDVDATSIVTTIPGTASPATSYHGNGQEECITTLADGSYVIYSFSGYRYTKKLATESAPLAIGLAITGVTSTGETVNLEYTYLDHNNDLEGSSEIKWYLSDDDQGTNKTEITAAANATSYTILPADDGKYLTFSVLPVAQTGSLSFPANLVESSYYGPVLSTVAAPEASNLAITGDLNVYSKITGSYDYSDENGDLEGASIIKWYAADDAAGANQVFLAENTSEYTLQPADENKYIIFTVTPVALTGGDLEGDSVAVISSTTVVFPAFAPTVENVSISGREEVAAPLKATYTYKDLNGDLEGASVLKWYRADDATGTNQVEVASGTDEYTVVAADEGKYILFEVTPVTVDADAGTAVFVSTGIIAAEPAPEAPVASNVTFHGTPEVGAVMYGSYTYSDRTDDPEGASVLKWYAADDKAGVNKAEITSAAGDYTFTVTEDLVGKFLLFEVTPVATVGGLLTGTAVEDTSLTAVVASTNDGDFDRTWIRSNKTGAIPEYMGTGSTERGFAVGADHLYIASRNGGTKLLVVNKTNGSLVREMNTDGMDVGLFKISDVEVSTDGQILACPLQIDASTAPFVVYKWSDELAAPTKFIEYTATEALRLGDKFTVVGDVSADAVIYAAASQKNFVVRWVVTGGIPDAGTVITLQGTTSIGSTAAAYPFSTSADADFIVDGRGFQAQVFDKDGTYLYPIEGVGQSQNQSNSPNVFYYKGRTLAAFHQKKDNGEWNVIVRDITSTTQTTVGVSETLSTANQELGGVHVELENDNFVLYMLSANNGLARFEGSLELPTFLSAETNFAGDMIYVQFSKNMPDDVVAIDGWTVKVNDVASTISSITGVGTDGDVLSFTLATAITEGQTVTIEYDGTGTTSAFDATPLAAFTAESVVNIVGADVPVATNVAITGNANPTVTLTGTYTFSDPDGDLEGTSTYQWWVADDDQGTNALKILGEKSTSYVVTNDVLGKYVAFEVTPVSATGGADYLIGTAVASDWLHIVGVGFANNNINAVSLYPNPVNDILTLNNCETVQSVSLIDITGKVLFSRDNNGENLMTIPMNKYSNGIYYIRLNADGNFRIEKVVKID
jgi:hypothetical protein